MLSLRTTEVIKSISFLITMQKTSIFDTNFDKNALEVAVHQTRQPKFIIFKNKT